LELTEIDRKRKQSVIDAVRLQNPEAFPSTPRGSAACIPTISSRIPDLETLSSNDTPQMFRRLPVAFDWKHRDEGCQPAEVRLISFVPRSGPECRRQSGVENGSVTGLQRNIDGLPLDLDSDIRPIKVNGVEGYVRRGWFADEWCVISRILDRLFINHCEFV